MTIAAQLEIDLAMSIAQLTKDVGDAKRVITSGMREINDAVETTKKLLGALGVGLGLKELIDFARNTNDATARMKELGIEAGTTAEAISRFDAPARKANSSIDAVAQAMFRMSKAAVEARDPSTKAAEALKAIGLSTEDFKNLKPDEIFELVARRLGEYDDGIEKNLALQILFGKSGKETSRIVAEIAASQKLASTTSNQQAEEASKLNSQIVDLKMQSEAFWRSLIAQGVPALTEILGAFNKARTEMGLVEGAIAAVSLAFEKMFGSPEERQKSELGGINAQITAIKEWQDASRNEIVTEATRIEYANKLNGLLQRRGELESVLFQAELDAQDARAMAGQHATGGKKPLHLDGGSGTASASDVAYQAELANLDKEIAKLSHVGELEAYLQKLEEDRFKLLTPAQREELTNKERRLLQLKAEIEARALILKSGTEWINALQKMRDVEQAAHDSARDQVEQAQFDLALLGKTSDEQAKLNALHAIDLELKRQIQQVDVEDGDFQSAAQIAESQRLTEIAEKRKASIGSILDQKKAIQDQLSVWTEISNAAGNFFSDLVMHGKSAFDNLRTYVKQLFADMIKLFAQRWILQLAASATGSGALGNAAASNVGGSIAGSVVQSAGSSLFGSVISGAGTGVAGAFGTSALTAGGDFVGTGLAGLAGNAVLAAGATDAFAASVAAAVPVIGWIVAIGMVLYAIFGSKGGAPKGGGSFMGSFDSMTGALIGGSSSVPGTDNGRFFTPNQGDPQMQQFATSIGGGFAQTLAALGGKGGNLSFGFGFDTDPGGTAQNRVSGMVRDAGGNVIFDQHDLSVGRDPQALQDAIGLEGQRAILAGLQHSEFPKAISDILNSIVAEGASAADIQKVLSAAMEMKGVLDGLAVLNAKGLDIDALKAWQRQGESIGQTFQRVATQFAQFDNAFTSDSDKLLNAQQAITKTFGDLGIAVPKSDKEFYDLVHGIDLSTQSGRDMFDMLMKVAPAFQSVEQAAAGMIGTFNQIMGQLRGDGFTRSLMQGQMDAALTQFRTSHSWSSQYDNQGLLQQLLTITPEDFAAYVGGDPTGAALINTILGLYATLNQAAGGPSSSVGAATTTITDFGAAVDATAQQLAGAKVNIAQYLNGLLVGNLSPLSPGEQLSEAGAQFDALVHAAQGGDLNAYSQLQGSSNTLLQLGRTALGSGSDYVTLFQHVFDSLAGVSGTTGYNQRMVELQSSQLDVMSDVRSILTEIVDRLDHQNAIVADQTNAIPQKTASAINSLARK